MLVFEPIDLGRCRRRAGLDPPVIGLNNGRSGAGFQRRIVEQQGHIVKQRAFIALQRQRVIASYSTIFRDGGLAVEFVPLRANIFSSLGGAVDSASAAICANTSRCSSPDREHVQGRLAAGGINERRNSLPSMVAAQKTVGQLRKLRKEGSLASAKTAIYAPGRRKARSTTRQSAVRKNHAKEHCLRAGSQAVPNRNQSARGFLCRTFNPPARNLTFPPAIVRPTLVQMNLQRDCLGNALREDSRFVCQERIGSEPSPITPIDKRNPSRP